MVKGEKQESQLNISQTQSEKITEKLSLLKKSVEIKKQQNGDLKTMRQMQIMKQNQPKQCPLCRIFVMDLRQHMRRKHPDNFLEKGENNLRYKACQFCKTVFKNENFDEHQLACEQKFISKERSKTLNKLRVKKEEFESLVVGQDDLFQQYFSEFMQEESIQISEKPFQQDDVNDLSFLTEKTKINQGDLSAQPPQQNKTDLNSTKETNNQNDQNSISQLDISQKHDPIQKQDNRPSKDFFEGGDSMSEEEDEKEEEGILNNNLEKLDLQTEEEDK
ncbi:hypothetical protein ABPG72_019833 [Tetrahymena utriculariae]